MDHRELADIAAQPAERPAVAFAPAPAPHLARVLDLQRSAGNAAVARWLARDATDAPAAPAEPSSDVAGLAARVRSAAGLRAALAADPGLAQRITAYFAAGNADESLNALMGQAFTKPVEQEAGAEKNPTDPTVALPAARTGDKKLAKGQMKWKLAPVNHSSARADVDFKPDTSTAEAKNVSFGQTVLNQVGGKRAYAGGTAADPGKQKATYEPYEEAASKKRADHAVGSENDPFYGAEWDQTAKKWKDEAGGVQVGKAPKGGTAKSALLNDTPTLPWAREGGGDAAIEFETVAMVLETREPLGALKWGFSVKDTANAPLVLTGAEDADATDTPSGTWGATMDKFYEAKFEILDSFDGGKSDLKPDHKTKLDTIVTKMKATVALKAQLGGAADFGGDKADAATVSLKRAEAARDYLVSKGIDASRLEIQSYGSDWARVETTTGKDEPKNRRVQIWLR